MSTSAAGIHVDVLRTVDQVDSAEWNAMCAGRSFADYRFLRLTEHILVGHEPRYVLVRRQGRLAACAVCSIGSRFGNRALQRRLGWVLRPFRWLRCAVPVSSELGIFVQAAADNARLAQLLFTALRRLMLRERAPFLIVDGLSPDQHLWRDLRQDGFRQHSQWTDFSLQIDWTSSTDYLSGMPGGHRRELGRLQRQAERQGIVVERLRVVEQHQQRLRTLVGEVLVHHGTHDAYAPDFLPRARAILGDDLQVVAAWQGGEIIGCMILIRDRDAMIGKWVGLDYARTWGTATYRLLMFECVRLAIELGVRRLGLGPTAGEIKREFGALPQERSSAMTVIGRAPTPLVGALARIVAGRAAVDPTYSSARRGGV